MLLETAARVSDRAAVVDSSGTTDFGTLAQRSLGVRDALADSGVLPSDRVGIFATRGHAASAAFFGVLGAGGIAVMLNEALRPRQLEHALSHADAKILLITADTLRRLPRQLDIKAHILDLAELPASGSLEVAPRVGTDAAHIVYTSGSTGMPKGVTISHGNLWAGTQAVVEYLRIGSNDRIASLLPFSFDYGLNQLLCCVGTGATLVVEASPVAHRIVQALRDRGVTVLPAVPPLWLQLLSVESFCEKPIESLRLMTNTGGRLPTDAVRRLRRSQPQSDLVLMYGLTEAFRSTYLAPESVDRKPDSIGRAIPGAEILVINDAGGACGPGEPGELVHRGPTVTLGYWNDDEATAKVFRSNPLRPAGTPASERVIFSGDLVRRDEEGDLFFLGRRDGLIKSLGHRVSPDEIIDVLYGSGEIVEAVVTAEPDELRGAQIIVYAVLAKQGDLQRLKSFCDRELPRYMQPSRIEARASLPRTLSGKHDAAAAAVPETL